MLVRGLLAAATSLGLIGFASAAERKITPEDIAPPASAADSKVPSFFLFSDTQVSYRHVFTAAEPGIPNRRTPDPSDGRDIPKNVFNFAHADAWQYGTNFLSLDILHSGSQDPAGTRNKFANVSTTYNHGATEFYGLYRGTLSGNKIFGANIFVIPGIIKDVSLSYGFDGNTKNTPFGPRKKLVVGGLTFSLDVPVGFLNVAVHASQEYNRNGFFLTPYREVEFTTTPEFEITYNFPLDDLFGGIPIKLAGFNNIILPKGHVASPTSVPTTTEWLSRTNVVLDVGKILFNQPGKLDVFAGFQYWRNKFGNNKDYYNRATTPSQYLTTFSGAGAEEKTALVGVAYHL